MRDFQNMNDREGLQTWKNEGVWNWMKVYIFNIVLSYFVSNDLLSSFASISCSI
jgi:hypothetical protein